MYDIEKIKKDLESNLSEFRFDHSIRVADEAKKLAKYYKLDEEKAYITGLIHDIAKEFTDEENEKWVEKYKLPKELLLPEFRNIIHADIGAVVAKELYGLDEEVCNAIKYHTIGHFPMNLLDKIIFLSDKIGRKVSKPYIEEIRNLIYKDLDEALKIFLIKQKQNLENSGEKIHPITLELLNSLL